MFIFRFASLMVVFASSLALADTETYSLFRYEPPPGERAEQGGVVSYTRIDNTAGTFCRVVLGEAVPSTGSAESDFDSEWHDFVEANMEVARPPAGRSGKTSGGVPFIEGRADVMNQGNPFHYLMLSFTADGRRASVQIIGGNEAQATTCRGQLQRFLGSLAIVGGAARPPASPAPATPVTANANVGTWKGASPRGVWMAHIFAPLTGSYAPIPNWLVLYDDGLAYTSVPRDGLQGFDRASSRAKGDVAWAKWTWNGDKGATQSLSNPRSTAVLRFDSGGRILLVDSDRYSRCANVDGLRLDGAWTSYADPDDPALGALPVGQRPLIRFQKNGRFVDEGLLSTFLMAGPDKPDGEPPGAGSYSIQDFTLTLRYDDGRVTHNALNGFLDIDPSKDPKYLMLRRVKVTQTRQ